MVVIHLKIGNGARSGGVGTSHGTCTNKNLSMIGGADDGFLFETTTDTSNDNLINDLIVIYNLRLLSKALIDSVRGLALHGPMKSDDEKDLCQKQQAAFISGDSNIDGNYQHKPDPSGLRTGYAPTQPVVDAMEGSVGELERYIHPDQVQRRVNLSQKEIYDLIANVRGSVTMAYPMGLPAHEMTRQLLDYIDTFMSKEMPQDAKGNHRDMSESADTEKDVCVLIDKTKNVSLEESILTKIQQPNYNNITGKSPIPGLLNSDTTTLWAAGKEFVRGKLVRDRLGGSRNEKTKLVAKFQAVGQGAPSREPIVSQDEQLAMMAYYHKRQEELKRLAESDDDDYLHSAWADPKGLKKNLHQLSDAIQAPGVRRAL